MRSLSHLRRLLLDFKAFVFIYIDQIKRKSAISFYIHTKVVSITLLHINKVYYTYDKLIINYLLIDAKIPEIIRTEYTKLCLPFLKLDYEWVTVCNPETCWFFLFYLYICYGFCKNRKLYVVYNTNSRCSAKYELNWFDAPAVIYLEDAFRIRSLETCVFSYLQWLYAVWYTPCYVLCSMIYLILI